MTTTTASGTTPELLQWALGRYIWTAERAAADPSIDLISVPKLVLRVTRHAGYQWFDRIGSTEYGLVFELVERLCDGRDQIGAEKALFPLPMYVVQERGTPGCRLRQVNASMFRVLGDHGGDAGHLVELTDTWQCDCDRFHGRKKYNHHQGVCAHIMFVAVMLALRSDPDSNALYMQLVKKIRRSGNQRRYAYRVAQRAAAA